MYLLKNVSLIVQVHIEERKKKKCLLSPRHSTPLPQIAPEPHQENLVVADNHLSGETKVAGLPDQNNMFRRKIFDIRLVGIV